MGVNYLFLSYYVARLLCAPIATRNSAASVSSLTGLDFMLIECFRRLVVNHHKHMAPRHLA